MLQRLKFQAQKHDEKNTELDQEGKLQSDIHWERKPVGFQIYFGVVRRFRNSSVNIRMERGRQFSNEFLVMTKILSQMWILEILIKWYEEYRI